MELTLKGLFRHRSRWFAIPVRVFGHDRRAVNPNVAAEGRSGNGKTGRGLHDRAGVYLYIIRPQHINPYGRLFGGFLMQWIDEVSGVVSRRHCGHTVTTASVDNLSFKAGAYENDMIVLVGKMTYTGTTSMEIRVGMEL